MCHVFWGLPAVKLVKRGEKKAKVNEQHVGGPETSKQTLLGGSLAFFKTEKSITGTTQEVERNNSGRLQRKAGAPGISHVVRRGVTGGESETHATEEVQAHINRSPMESRRRGRRWLHQNHKTYTIGKSSPSPWQAGNAWGMMQKKESVMAQEKDVGGGNRSEGILEQQA